MSEAIYDNIYRYVVSVICEQPMHVGSADGDKEDILKHPATGQPFVQASAIAGVLADYIQKVYGEEKRRQLFGDSAQENGIKGKSRVVVLDGNFVPETVKLEMRTRCSLNGATGSVNAKQVIGSDAVSGQLAATEYIGTGAELCFAALIYGTEFEKIEDVVEKIEDAFAAVHAGKIRFGGQNTMGFGRVSIKEIKKSSYRMEDADDRRKWAELIDMYTADGLDITYEIKRRETMLKDKDYRITFQARLDTALLIKADMIDEERIIKSLGSIDKMPDFMNIANAKREYIIPGTSLKGVFRSRIETIGEYLKLPPEQVEEVFEQRSKILFEDAVIWQDYSIERKRIHINKISGGTKYKALFSECVTGGEAEITIHVDSASLERSLQPILSAKACIAMLLYVIRDLAVGAVSLGSGASIGRGFVNVGRVVIWENSQEKADFSLAAGQDVENAFVAECLKELETID